MGFSVELSGDGLAAVSRFREGERYRLVLVDRNIPKMEGPEAIREILAHLQNASPSFPPPVFAGLTGQTERCNDFEEAGAVKTVLKPITSKNLEAVFEELDFDNLCRGDRHCRQDFQSDLGGNSRSTRGGETASACRGDVRVHSTASIPMNEIVHVLWVQAP
uniref:Response regulatory domain-containing protein n=1 Tax=Chromera velia CCMP2878 TaxID=1169474 RepID=A0A0G4FLW3_9ALVE|eukprot:Cvel_17612.t1-p1 / transcript=Cvel_17612.t1 / gene=Cvel_17612 / organism=Chromera_velia_CCMP2878 / gene_product=hypothetical protein / transcript_product=hypothetical protein / location=Cvel_scaffold1416:33526-34096(+) / protein_length=161 / sequence_SO=supercontig / SO=protein_coding / is_pseudo=false